MGVIRGRGLVPLGGEGDAASGPWVRVSNPRFLRGDEPHTADIFVIGPIWLKIDVDSLCSWFCLHSDVLGCILDFSEFYLRIPIMLCGSVFRFCTILLRVSHLFWTP